MTAIDGQDVAGDLATVAASGVDHVSTYTLTIEAGTRSRSGGWRSTPRPKRRRSTPREVLSGVAGLSR